MYSGLLWMYRQESLNAGFLVFNIDFWNDFNKRKCSKCQTVFCHFWKGKILMEATTSFKTQPVRDTAFSCCWRSSNSRRAVQESTMASLEFLPGLYLWSTGSYWNTCLHLTFVLNTRQWASTKHLGLLLRTCYVPWMIFNKHQSNKKTLHQELPAEYNFQSINCSSILLQVASPCDLYLSSQPIKCQRKGKLRSKWLRMGQSKMTQIDVKLPWCCVGFLWSECNTQPKILVNKIVQLKANSNATRQHLERKNKESRSTPFHFQLQSYRFEHSALGRKKLSQNT